MTNMSTPWGRADSQQFVDPARQIVNVSTASHGGLGVSRDLPMPAYFQKLAIDDGVYLWFEEDCCWSAVPICFPQFFSVKTQESAKATLRNWYPSAYQAHFKVQLKPEESMALEQTEWEARTRGNFVVVSGYGDWAWDVPKGHVYALGHRGADGAEVGFLVPQHEYVKPHRLILDAYPRWEPDRSLPYTKPAGANSAA